MQALFHGQVRRTRTCVLVAVVNTAIDIDVRADDAGDFGGEDTGDGGDGDGECDDESDGVVGLTVANVHVRVHGPRPRFQRGPPLQLDQVQGLRGSSLWCLGPLSPCYARPRYQCGQRTATRARSWRRQSRHRRARASGKRTAGACEVIAT